MFKIVEGTLSNMEDGSRFGHFWWFYARVYYVYILVDQPWSDRNLMVLWAKAPGFKARHFAVLWFDPQSSNIFFHKINFSLIIFLSFNFEKYFFYSFLNLFFNYVTKDSFFKHLKNYRNIMDFYFITWGSSLSYKNESWNLVLFFWSRHIVSPNRL